MLSFEFETHRPDNPLKVCLTRTDGRSDRRHPLWGSEQFWQHLGDFRNILVGGFKPSEKYESQLEWLFPIYGKNKSHVPNHQHMFSMFVPIDDQMGMSNYPLVRVFLIFQTTNQITRGSSSFSTRSCFLSWWTDAAKKWFTTMPWAMGQVVKL